MAIVARGLGLPEDGALVAGGFGTVEVDSNAMTAALTGSTATVVATLTAAGDTATVGVFGGAKFIEPRHLVWPAVPKKPKQARPITATLTGSGRIVATLDYTIDFDADLELLLLLAAA